MDDGASEEESAKWRAGRKEKRPDAGSMVRSMVCSHTRHRSSRRQADTAGCAHTQRQCPRHSGVLDDREAFMGAVRNQGATLIVVGEWDALNPVTGAQAVF